MILVLFSLFGFSSKVSLSNLDQPPLLQVLGPPGSRAVWRLHQGEDPADPRDQAARGGPQGGGGGAQVPQGVQRQQCHDHLLELHGDHPVEQQQCQDTMV